jgi:hypothetical protein
MNRLVTVPQAPEGRKPLAQGNALGTGSPHNPQALKGRQNRGGTPLSPFQG